MYIFGGASAHRPATARQSSDMARHILHLVGGDAGTRGQPAGGSTRGNADQPAGTRVNPRERGLTRGNAG